MVRRLISVISVLALLSVLQACNAPKKEGAKPAPTAPVENVERPAAKATPSSQEAEDQAPTEERAQSPQEEPVANEEALGCGVMTTAASAFDENGKELAKLDAADPVGVANEKPVEEGTNKGRIEVRLFEDNVETGKAAWIDKDAVGKSDTCG